MHIALFTDSNIRFLDGVARIIQELINYISKHPEHRLTVFHREKSKAEGQEYADNVLVHGFSMPTIGIPNYDAYPFSYLVSPKRRICQILKKTDVDVMMTITPYISKGIGHSAIYVSKKLHKPLVGSFDVPLEWYSEYYLRSLFGESILASIFRKYISGRMKAYKSCDMILVPSKSMDAYVKERYSGMDTAFFHRAVDSDSFNPEFRSPAYRANLDIENKTVIMFAGRLALEKSLSVLCDVFRRLKIKYNDLVLLLVGDGPEKARLEKENIPDLLFTGALFDEQLRQAYASSDIFAYSSVVDAGPMAILEAMASGLPAVVFKGGGTHEVVSDGETGFVVEDEARFEACIEKLIVDKQLRATMSGKAREQAVNRNWNTIWGDVIDALEDSVRKFQ